MKKIPAVILSLFIGGCAYSGPVYKSFWKKEGSTYQHAVTTEAGCQYEVGMAKFDSSAEKQQLIQACMMKEGFRWGTYVAR